MSIETTVELCCDACGQERIFGSTVSGVKAEARAEGWRLTRTEHFCGCDEEQEQ